MPITGSPQSTLVEFDTKECINKGTSPREGRALSLFISSLRMPLSHAFPQKFCRIGLLCKAPLPTSNTCHQVLIDTTFAQCCYIYVNVYHILYVTSSLMLTYIISYMLQNPQECFVLKMLIWWSLSIYWQWKTRINVWKEWWSIYCQWKTTINVWKNEKQRGIPVASDL